jgi:hypothetical protein
MPVGPWGDAKALGESNNTVFLMQTHATVFKQIFLIFWYWRGKLVEIMFSSSPPICLGSCLIAHVDSFRFKRAAFYNGLKSKVGLAAAKAAALRVNLNVQGCGIVAPPMHAPSRTPLLLPLLLSHNLPTPRVH